MTGPVDGLIAFLQRRLRDDRELAAELASHKRVALNRRDFGLSATLATYARHLDTDVTTKSLIIKAFVRCASCARGITCHLHEFAEDKSNWRFAYPYEEGIAKLLALTYAEHPDYREEWRP